MLLPVTPEEVRQKLGGNEAELLALRVRRLWLFGSSARGEARPDSDLDILVEFEGPCTYAQYSSLRCLLEDVLGRKVDLVEEAALRPRVRPFVERDAVRVA